ncbi:hypothetical protein [Microvirga sp. TS319]|uniref:hypothetical protein n=1 Tax=Microvirga sp. TS319 TaxID=3241165 RepID=UPI003519F154
MTKPLLILAAWCLGFASALLGLTFIDRRAPKLTGTVVLDFKPFCQDFVVQTGKGFVILLWEDGTLFFGEGDTLVGPLHSQGSQLIEAEGRGVMTARVGGLLPDLGTAQQVFRERCGLGPDTPLSRPTPN